MKTSIRDITGTFQPGELSIGIVVPIEYYGQHAVPEMAHHMERVKLIEELGYRALWLRDIPYHVPSFGDAGQLFDPFTYLGYLAGQTSEIALGVASIALPLHHPAHVVKAAASIDQLSHGRLILGVASGDRPDEYPAMGIDHSRRGDLFREAFDYMRQSQDPFPMITTTSYGRVTGNMDIMPKAYGHKLPLLITGSSRQSMEWNAEHGDGWMNYPRNLLHQQLTIAQWREVIKQYHSTDRPFMQPLYVVLHERNDFKPQPIQLGFRTGIDYLIDYIYQLRDIGVNHLALNLRFNTMDMKETLNIIAEKAFPLFHEEKQLAESK